jgi:hypothetical protein
MLLEWTVGDFEALQVVVCRHVVTNCLLARDELARTPIALLVDDTVLVVVDAVERVSGSLEVGITEVSGAAARAGKIAPVSEAIPGVDVGGRGFVELAVEEGVVVIRLEDARR